MNTPPRKLLRPSQVAAQDATAPQNVYRSNPSSPAAQGNEPGSFQAAGVKALRKTLPINAATFVQDLLDNKLPLTEQDLTNEDIVALRQAGRRPNVDGFVDYGSYAGKHSLSQTSLVKKINDPNERMKTTVGSTMVKGMPSHARIEDTFDFNERDPGNPQNQFSLVDMLEVSGGNPYTALRYMGGTLGSADGQGVPMNIDLGNMKRPRTGEFVNGGGFVPQLPQKFAMGGGFGGAGGGFGSGGFGDMAMNSPFTADSFGANLPVEPAMQWSPGAFNDNGFNVPDAAALGGTNDRSAESYQRIVGDTMSPEPAKPGEEKKNPFSMGGGGGGGGGKAAKPSLLDYAEHWAQRQEAQTQREHNRYLGNTDQLGAENPLNPFGDYTPNVGIGNNFQPTQHTPTQRFSYKTGGEYQLSPEEIAELRAQGYEIEELD